MYILESNKLRTLTKFFCRLLFTNSNLRAYFISFLFFFVFVFKNLQIELAWLNKFKIKNLLIIRLMLYIQKLQSLFNISY